MSAIAMRFFSAVMGLLAALIFVGTGLAHAQEDASTASYLTPFPKGDIYRVQVVGDDLADGLMNGLVEAFAGDARLEINRRTQGLGGLLRPDFEDKLAGLDAFLSADATEIAVVMLGAWDRASVKAAGGKRLQVGTAEWKAEYGQRADRLAKAIKRRNAAVYWVGLPNVRKPDFDEDAKMMNDILREKVYLNGFKYIDAYAVFADEQGGYSPYGPDLAGKMSLLRQGDGIYFTPAGNRKLAHFVEREIRRDVARAKADRNVPLAGSEAEQAKIRPMNAALAAPGAAPAAASANGTPQSQPPAPNGSSTAWAPVTTPGTYPATPAAEQGLADQKADNGKISLKILSQAGREEMVTLDIVRPAIPASVIALVTRRESADKPSQMGYSLVDQMAGGIAIMSSITPSSSIGSGSGGRGLSPTQSPFYKVLLKGERLTPKKGRADDFTWPRAEAPITPITKAVQPPVDDGLEALEPSLEQGLRDPFMKKPAAPGAGQTGSLRPPAPRN